MIVSTVLSGFFDANNKAAPDKLQASSKILKTLIDNCEKKPTIRYHNPKIQLHIVNMPGALDVLGLAGFSSQDQENKHGEKERMLVYRAGFVDQSLRKAISHELDTKLAELGAHTTIGSKLGKPKVQNDANTKAAADDGGDFLSLEERKKRELKAKEARKAKRAARSAALQKWQEDQQDRKEALARKEASKKHQEEDVDAKAILAREHGITIKPIARELAMRSAEERSKRTQKEDKSEDVVMPKLTEATGSECVEDKVMTPVEEAPVEKKPDAVSGPPPALAGADEAKWKEYLQTTPLCGPAEGIRLTSVFHQKEAWSATASASPPCLRKLLRELDTMNTTLPSDSRCTIWIRFDEETPQFLRAIIPAALPGPSPYAGGLFCFDIYIPDTYPNVAPKVVLLNTGGGTVRFGPNLYADGKVCLSLLGTWPGPKWKPGVSSLSQVLISIQGLILGVEHPYFLEPGHGGWEGTIKDGDFIVKGKTVSGKSVQEDVVPLRVAVYEDNLRVGTLRFAMDGLVSKHPPYLEAFQKPIALHFFHNRERILTEMSSWCVDRAVSAAKEDSMMNLFQHSSTPDTLEPKRARIAERLKKRTARLKTILMEMTEPTLAVAGIDVNDDDDDDEEDEDTKMPAVASEMAIIEDDEKKPSANMVEEAVGDPLEILKQQMQQAASDGNYVEAGKFQTQIQATEALQESMKKAAREGNFIRAGRLQEQLQARLDAIKKPASKSPIAASSEDDSDHDIEEVEEEMDDEMDEEDDGWDAPPGPMFGAGGFGASSLPPHAPSWLKNNRANNRHSWGTGTPLSSSAALTTKATNFAVASATVDKERMSKSGVLCRLRIRLPHNSTSVLEEFDAEDTLADVYRRVDPQIPSQSTEEADVSSPAVASVARRKHVMTAHGPQLVDAPVFSQPMSFKGYTLLLARPKREFSLEMHGTKTLKDLDLVPSATLTAMMCAERGMVRRGDLENRLNEAQGDAMDVEGLSYEGLLELTERVGVPDLNLEQDQLNENSTLLSPADYLAGTKLSEEDRRCLICLGDFDPADTELSLRKLKRCPHTFHVACLGTWLRKKSSCPICKQAIIEGTANAK